MNAEIAKYYKAVFRNFSPHVIVNDQGELAGYMIKFLRDLKCFDDINVTIIPSMEKAWGRKVRNSWNGILGMLQRNVSRCVIRSTRPASSTYKPSNTMNPCITQEGDFSLTPAMVSKDRFNDFPTSHPFFITRTQILFGTNQSNRNDIYSVIDKWIVVVLCGLAALIYMAGKLSSKCGKVKSELPVMFLLQCLLGTSPQGLKCEGVTRFLSAVWSQASFVVLVFVSSEMTSQFSNKLEALPFDSIDDIFHFPNADPFLMKNEAIYSFIRKNALTSPAFAEVIRRADANPHTCYQKISNLLENENMHAGIENREKFSIFPRTVLWNVIKARYEKTGKCKMKFSKPLMTPYRAIYFRRNISQTLIKTVNKRLRQLTEGDCYEDLNPSLKVESHPCQRTETPDVFAVINLKGFKAIFRVCILGFSASFITIFFEIYVNTLKVHMCTP